MPVKIYSLNTRLLNTYCRPNTVVGVGDLERSEQLTINFRRIWGKWELEKARFQGMKLWSILQAQDQKPRSTPGGNLVENVRKSGSGREKTSGSSKNVNLALTEVCPRERVNMNLYQALESKSALGWPQLEFLKRWWINWIQCIFLTIMNQNRERLYNIRQ